MADIAIDPRLRCSYCANAEDGSEHCETCLQVVYNASEGTAVCTGATSGEFSPSSQAAAQCWRLGTRRQAAFAW